MPAPTNSDAETTPSRAIVVSDACSTWVFRAKANCGPENLASGMKRCENDGCEARAEHIAEDATAIYFACNQCVSLIPGVNIIKSNTESHRTG